MTNPLTLGGNGPLPTPVASSQGETTGTRRSLRGRRTGGHTDPNVAGAWSGVETRVEITGSVKPFGSVPALLTRLVALKVDERCECREVDTQGVLRANDGR